MICNACISLRDCSEFSLTPLTGKSITQPGKDPPAVTMRVTPLVMDLARAQITLLPLRVADLDRILWGKMLYYIGDQEETCIANCGYTRAPVFRWYRGAKRDHKYSRTPQLTEKDAGYVRMNPGRRLTVDIIHGALERHPILLLSRS